MIQCVEIIDGRQLSDDLIADWRRIQAGEPDLASPYFCPEFTRHVSEVRDDVDVAILEEQGRVAGFFPYQRSRRRHARPVGGPLSDYQGLILPSDAQIDPLALLEKCRLKSWEFDHLLARQSALTDYHQTHDVSPVIDLRGGYDRYREERRAGGSKQLGTVERKQRKLAREVGPVRFTAQAIDEDALDRLWEWKSQQYLETGAPDVFAYEWTRELLRSLLDQQSDSFAGMLSTLHAGDELVAVHLGMRSETVWHYWFPTYDRQFAKYSPGLILLREMAEQAPALGISSIDLGKDDMRYKRQFSNASIALAEGAVPQPAEPSGWLATGSRVAEGIRQTPLVAPARVASSALRRYREWMRFG